MQTFCSAFHTEMKYIDCIFWSRGGKGMEPDRSLPDLTKKQPCNFAASLMGGWCIAWHASRLGSFVLLLGDESIDQTGLKVSSTMHPGVLYHYLSAKAVGWPALWHPSSLHAFSQKAGHTELGRKRWLPHDRMPLSIWGWNTNEVCIREKSKILLGPESLV